MTSAAERMLDLAEEYRVAKASPGPLRDPAVIAAEYRQAFIDMWWEGTDPEAHIGG